ncbi:MAG: alpha/beta hydrolase [Actinobacteria bacterium]|nr:alpha/beta hydrolase [Actinomycetota bacterium]
MGSTAKPGRITIDIAKDVGALADFLGLKRMVNVGLSGGGQHAIATGLDPRSVGVVTTGSLAPYEEMGKDFYLGMRQADIDEYADALRNINDLVKRFQSWQNMDMGAAFVPKEVSADDYSSYLKPWGFHPRDIKVPVVIWQGGLDENVPPVHGKWLAANIPNSTLKLIDDESHVGLYVNYEKETMQDAMNLLRA